MQTKSIKRLLTVTLAAALLVGSTLTAAATSRNGISRNGREDYSGGSSSSSASVEARVPEYWESLERQSANAPVMIAGRSVTTTIAGSIIVNRMQGVAVVTPLDQVKASLGLADGQTPFVTVLDTDYKKSNLAMDCVNAAVASLGGQFVSAINVNLTARENGKIVELTSGSAGMMVGLPKNADKSKTYCVVCVQPGGIITIMNDQDDIPETVTFEIKAGLGTYAFVAK